MQRDLAVSQQNEFCFVFLLRLCISLQMQDNRQGAKTAQ